MFHIGGVLREGRVLEWKLRMMDQIFILQGQGEGEIYYLTDAYHLNSQWPVCRKEGTGQHSVHADRQTGINRIRLKALAGALCAHTNEHEPVIKQDHSCSSALSCRTGKRI
jgi:hypothetical protein